MLSRLQGAHCKPPRLNLDHSEGEQSSDTDIDFLKKRYSGINLVCQDKMGHNIWGSKNAEWYKRVATGCKKRGVDVIIS